MKQNSLIYGLILVLLALLLIWSWPKSSTADQDPPARTRSSVESAPSEKQEGPIPERPILGTAEEIEKQKEEGRRSVVENVIGALNTPINFYGKVVDQNGDPVPYAKVGYGLVDKFNESGSKGSSSADASGIISLSGIRGAVISVSVHKEGYYHIQDISNQAFAYGIGPDSNTKSPPTKEDPAVFVLQKMGETESLVVTESRTFRISKDGTPVKIDLSTGRVSNTGQLQVQTWTEEPTPGGSRFYDWRCVISVPGGGLIEREGHFDFEAPIEGYKNSDEIVMPKDAEKWSRQAERQYFVLLPDSHYARIEFKIIAGGDHFFRMQSYLNPKLGSRNLEYDPEKRANP